MKENKVLDPFVKAVETGDDVMAKWILLKNNDKEINQIKEKNIKVEEALVRKKLGARIF